MFLVRLAVNGRSSKRGGEMRIAVLFATVAVVAIALPGGGRARDPDVRDDTTWLQARFDAAGGRVYLPKLPDGKCYQTRGLWVSHDNTVIDSNGACIVALGAGPARLTAPDGDAIPSDAVFFVNRIHPLDAAPVHVTIQGLKIVVPRETQMFGVAIYGHYVTVRQVTVTGDPVDAVYVGDRANGDGYSSHVAIVHTKLLAGGRNVLSAVSFIGLRIEHNTITGASNGYQGTPGSGGNPSAGIDIEPNSRGELALDLRIADNVIADNAGPGILVALAPGNGASLNATRHAIVGNRILRNGRGSGVEHGGIVFYGGESDGRGTVVVTHNVIRGNRGAAMEGWKMTMTADAHDNDLSGNDGGRMKNVRLKKR